jgi:hypothetical protein
MADSRCRACRRSASALPFQDAQTVAFADIAISTVEKWPRLQKVVLRVLDYAVSSTTGQHFLSWH